MNTIKKGLVCVLALCLLCSVAFASIQDGPLAVMEGDDWHLLAGADLLINQVDEKEVLYDFQLNRVSEGYDEVQDYRRGALVVGIRQGRETVKGVLRTDGSLRIPVQYTEIACEDEYVNAETDGGSIVAFGPDGTALEYVPSSLYDFSYILKDSREIPVDCSFDAKKNRYALADKNGGLLTDYLFDDICIWDFYTDDYCRISGPDDMEGLLGMDGTVIFPMEYRNVLTIDYGPYTTCGIFAALRDDAVAFAQDGAITVIPVENVDDVEFYGTCALIEYEDDTYAIARPDGTLQKLDADDCDGYTVGNEVFFLIEEEDAVTEEEEEVLCDDALNELLRTKGEIEFNRNGYVLVKDYGGTCTLYRVGGDGSQ